VHNTQALWYATGRLYCSIDSRSEGSEGTQHTSTMDSIPEDAVHSIQAHSGLQLVGLIAVLIVLQRIQYTAYKHNGMQVVGLGAKSSTLTALCSGTCRQKACHA